MATPAENKETVQRATDAFNELDREAFDPCYAEEVVAVSSGGERRMDHAEHWEEVLGMFEAVPDLHATTESMIAEDDRVFVRWTYSGTLRPRFAASSRTASGSNGPAGRSIASKMARLPRAWASRIASILRGDRHHRRPTEMTWIHDGAATSRSRHDDDNHANSQ